MTSRLYAMRIALPIIGVAVMLMVTINATAQVCGRENPSASTQAWSSGVGGGLDASRFYIARDLQFHSTLPNSKTYALPQGFYRYPHYVPIPGVYGNHYGDYPRPYVSWTPHFGWIRRGFSRRH